MSLSHLHSLNGVGQRPELELADILKRYLPEYRKSHGISFWQEKALYAIQVCRTSICGGHIEICDKCSYEHPVYNSCHNRHCPKCQGISRRRWVAARLGELLPVPYYHVVFTLPHRLNNLALYNKRLVYDLFYRAAAYTLVKFGNDAKYLGAQLGFMGVLHTWGKGLCYHIHWHFIIPGGGLTDEGQWVNLPYRDKYLFNTYAMSKVIRARFIKLLRKAYNNGELVIPDAETPLENPAMFEYFLNDIAGECWVNYTKRPFGGPEQVVKYIGRYTHRVALSNNRLLSIDGGKIRMQVRDYKKGGVSVPIELTATEFIRRFLMHILPKGFRKIRYGGFMAPAIRREKLKLALRILQPERPDVPGKELLPELDDTAIGKCPKCQRGNMRVIEIDRRNLRYHWLAWVDSS